MSQAPVPRWLLWASWAGLIWERVWPQIWVVPTLLAGFCAAALLGFLPIGPVWFQDLVWVASVIILIGFYYAGVAAIRWPDRQAVLRRIETASGLRHRPLSQTLTLDTDAARDPITAALWDQHRARMVASISGLRLPWPNASLAARDPFALRAAAALLLLVGFVIAGEDAPNRLLGELLPPLESGSETAVIAATEIWITPPDYTGLSPIYLAAPPADDTALSIPIGSHILAEVHNAGNAPILDLDGTERALQPDGDRDYMLTMPLPRIAALALRLNGTTLISKPINWIVDQPPSVAWTHRPLHTAHGALDLRFKATDDYGVAALDLVVQPQKTSANTKAETLSIPVPSPATPAVADEVFEDLTASPWAGLPVSLRLIAHDAIGQIGESAAVTMVLPERIFHQPVAKQIAAERKILLQSPDAIDDVADAVSAISLWPTLYNNDFRAFLAMRVAARQLADDDSQTAIDQASALLWHTAIRIDDGASGQAEATMRDAENALRDALRRNAPPAEIHQLMQALRKAISEYLQAMAKNGGAQPRQPQGQGNLRTITPGDIDQMLAHAESLARSGDQAGADAAMAQLQKLMESLQFGGASGGAGSDALNRLAQLARQQQQLLDQGEQRENGVAGAPDLGKSLQDQTALGQQLDALSHQLRQGGMPMSSQMRQAAQAMADAVKALGRGNDGNAIQSQSQALTAMRSAAQGLEQMLQNQAGGSEEEGAGQDPFGRDGGEGNDTTGDNDLAIPRDQGLNRSRVILDELRRRQGDLERPQQERDYIDRLLENF